MKILAIITVFVIVDILLYSSTGFTVFGTLLESVSKMDG